MPYKHLALLVAAAALCAGAARAVLVVIPGMPGLFLSITMGALVYFAAVRLFHALPQEDIDRLHSLISPLFDRFRRTIQTTWRRLRPS
jgi:hypothetical protein